MQSIEKVVYITGATGFVGQHVVPELLSNNYKVYVLYRSLDKIKNFKWHERVELIPFDYHDERINFKVESQSQLFHLAWKGLPNYNSSFHFEENLPKSYQFIKDMIDAGVRKVLVSGTCFEYGLQSGPLFSDQATQPNTPYSFAKDSLRKSLSFLQKEKDFELQWARLFYMYGEGQSPSSLLPLLDKAIDENVSEFKMSGGEQLRDYLPVTTVAQRLVDLFKSKKNGVFNICHGKPISVRKLVEDRIKERGSDIKLNLGHYPYPNHEPMAFWGIQEPVSI